MPKSPFGVVIKKMRLQRGFTQEMLASTSGLERTFISMLERGIKQPSLKTVCSLAKALSLKNYELLHMVEQEIQLENAAHPADPVAQKLQHKLAILELEDEKSRISDIINTIPIVFFARTPLPEYAATFVSKNISHLFGYERDRFMEHSGFWHAHIHKEDLPKVEARLQTLKINQILQHEYRFLTANGQWLLVREELKLVANEAGAPKEVIGSIVEATAIKTP